MHENKQFSISGNIVDVVKERIFKGTVLVANGHIQSVTEEPVSEEQFILPGFVDAHIHIESAMLIPSEFARLAVVHGTVGTVSDPHEIANVVGIDGVKYMIKNGNKVPFKFNFGAPSCVPATIFETAGASIDINMKAENISIWSQIVKPARAFTFNMIYYHRLSPHKLIYLSKPLVGMLYESII